VASGRFPSTTGSGLPGGNPARPRARRRRQFLEVTLRRRVHVISHDVPRAQRSVTQSLRTRQLLTRLARDGVASGTKESSSRAPDQGRLEAELALVKLLVAAGYGRRVRREHAPRLGGVRAHRRVPRLAGRARRRRALAGRSAACSRSSGGNAGERTTGRDRRTVKEDVHGQERSRSRRQRHDRPRARARRRITDVRRRLDALVMELTAAGTTDRLESHLRRHAGTVAVGRSSSRWRWPRRFCFPGRGPAGGAPWLAAPASPEGAAIRAALGVSRTIPIARRRRPRPSIGIANRGRRSGDDGAGAGDDGAPAGPSSAGTELAVKRPRTLLGLALAGASLPLADRAGLGMVGPVLAKGAPPPDRHFDIDGRAITVVRGQAGRVQIWLPSNTSRRRSPPPSSPPRTGGSCVIRPGSARGSRGRPHHAPKTPWCAAPHDHAQLARGCS